MSPPAEPARASPAFSAPVPLALSLSTSLRLSHAPPRCSAAPSPSSPAPLSRRALLHAATALAASTALASPAAALSKKRILAKAGPEVVMDNGIVYRDITLGKGYSPSKGDTVAVHYSLFYDDLEVESSRESQGLAALPLGFSFGAESGPGAAMKGLNLGIVGMKVGGLRLITIPSKFAFGEKGKLPLIPPNATVDMAVSLLSCKPAGMNVNSLIDSKAQVY